MRKLFLVAILASAVLSARVEAEEPPLKIEPIFTEQQREGNHAFFDLIYNNIKEVKSQDLTLKITNTSKEEQVIKAYSLSTSTSQHGSFEYYQENPQTGQEITDSQFELGKYLTPPKGNITVLPQETIEVTYSFNPPNDFKLRQGELLGGLGIELIEGDNYQQDNFTVENKVIFITALHLTIGDTLATKITFDNSKIEILPQHAYYALTIPMENNTPSVLTGAKLEYEVSTGGKILFKTDTPRETSVAPMTKTSLQLPWVEGELVEEQSYLLKGTLTYDKTVVPFGGDFTYTGQEDFLYEGQDISPPKTKEKLSIPAWPYLTPLPLIIVALLLFRNRKPKYMMVLNDSTQLQGMLIGGKVGSDKPMGGHDLTSLRKNYNPFNNLESHPSLTDKEQCILVIYKRSKQKEPGGKVYVFSYVSSKTIFKNN